MCGAGPKIALCFLCLSVCVSPVITCAIVAHCCHVSFFTLVDLTAALSTGIATVSSLAQLQVEE